MKKLISMPVRMFERIGEGIWWGICFIASLIGAIGVIIGLLFVVILAIGLAIVGGTLWEVFLGILFLIAAGIFGVYMFFCFILIDIPFFWENVKEKLIRVTNWFEHMAVD